MIQPHRSQDFIDQIRDGGIPGLRINPDNPAMAYDAMDQNTPPGSKVRFTGHGGYGFDREYAARFMTVGLFYTVEKIDVGSCSSTVEFREFPGHRFNTVMFERALPKHRPAASDDVGGGI